MLKITEQLRELGFSEIQIKRLCAKLNRRGFGFRTLLKVTYNVKRDGFYFWSKDEYYGNVLVLSAPFCYGE